MANNAYVLGAKAWEEVKGYKFDGKESIGKEKNETCSDHVTKNGKLSKDEILKFDCGLEVGASITLIGVVEKGSKADNKSQFVVELLGLKGFNAEDAPKILHFNPRLKGDWSGKPVIEVNTCYRMQWGTSLRCRGLESDEDDETVDGYNKCEKWIHDNMTELKEPKSTSWLNRFIGRPRKPEMTWPFPFEKGKVFVMTIRAGMEGYHIYVGGRHVTSFPYRPGFTLEDATGLVIKGNVQVNSVYATSLPTSHPSFSIENVLEMSEKWKSPPIPNDSIYLFIGILSAPSHFSERMAVRKSWMQYPDIKSSYAVARFFVALGQKLEVNALLKKEAEYFGDVIILPFIDHYELVVLKTIAICEYGVSNVTAEFIMKCDDDTFVRVDVILGEISNLVASNKSLYLGNINLKHRPLRNGKWAVTHEEWPELIYPPYANGPGYIISSDIARFIVSKHANQSLRMFKMEDVSMGMWVEEFNLSHEVRYIHSWKFCQFGCIQNYYTAHYQSPRQMSCLWDKLLGGAAHCCNYR